MSQILALRDLLESGFPDSVPVTYRSSSAVPTGVGALDRALPGEGLPRGRLTAWAPGGGATAVLRGACRQALGRGERTAWIDGAGVMAGSFWWGEAALFRPADRREALECAEELVRTGGFGLIVLTGTRTVDAERVRLSRAAREGGGALVSLDADGFMAAVRISCWIGPDGYRWRRDAFGEPAEVESVIVQARVRAMGWSRDTEFTLKVADHGLRLGLEPRLVDRRGADPRTVRAAAEAPPPGHAASAGAAGGAEARRFSRASNSSVRRAGEGGGRGA